MTAKPWTCCCGSLYPGLKQALRDESHGVPGPALLHAQSYLEESGQQSLSVQPMEQSTQAPFEF